MTFTNAFPRKMRSLQNAVRCEICFTHTVVERRVEIGHRQINQIKFHRTTLSAGDADACKLSPPGKVVQTNGGSVRDNELVRQRMPNGRMEAGCGIDLKVAIC